MPVIGVDARADSTQIIRITRKGRLQRLAKQVPQPISMFLWSCWESNPPRKSP
jgi:hypothetical protein